MKTVTIIFKAKDVTHIKYTLQLYSRQCQYIYIAGPLLNEYQFVFSKSVCYDDQHFEEVLLFMSLTDCHICRHGKQTLLYLAT